MENIKLTCHIIGLNAKNKKIFTNKINKKEFNIIDLDDINQYIIADAILDKLYRSFIKLKEDKNDKYKEIDKKMSNFWENKFNEKLNEEISFNKKNIFIGMNSHYKVPSKKISLQTKNNFIVKTDPNEEIKTIIENNLDSNRSNIINGNFPLEYLNYDFLMKKRETLFGTYIKSGYLEKNLEEIIMIIQAIETDKNSNELWISMKQPYNLNSKIHPKNNIIYAYNNPTIALIESFEFNDDEIEKNLITENDSTSLSIKEIKPMCLEKLKSKRFLYQVDKNTFLPIDNYKTKYFTQAPVDIKNKEKITNVFEYLKIN
jgi:hypothetical protein